METIACPNDQQLNEVKVSSGHNKPENKGKKYFTCLKCSEFFWVENGVPISPRTGTLKVDQSQYDKPDTPFKKPVTQTAGYKKFEEVGKSIKASVEDEPMTSLQWNYKEFRKQFGYITSPERQQGMTPRQAMELNHTWDWMDAMCGDMKGYIDWKDGVIERAYASADPGEVPSKKSMSEDPIEAFDEYMEEEENGTTN